jgi:FixJ family two-component response regulator
VVGASAAWQGSRIRTAGDDESFDRSIRRTAVSAAAPCGVFAGVDYIAGSTRLAAAHPQESFMTAPTNSASMIYVVDDDPEVRDGLALLFESVGLGCQVFASVREFLQSKPSGEANCLILDIRMPETGGLDFQIELTKARNKIPIIFISGHGDVPMTVKAMKGGAVDFLTKPLREQDVLDAVRLALERDFAERKRRNELSDLQVRFETLSEREREVMRFVIAGVLNKQTAAELALSEVTVKVHRHNLMNKFGVKSVADLVRIADSLGISGWHKSEDQQSA